MKNPFAKPKCEHGVPMGETCRQCGYLAEARSNWLYSSPYGWMRDRFVIPLFFGSFGLTVLAIFSGILVVSHITSSKECARYERISDADTDYDFWGGGCFVETEDGNWVTLDTYKNQHNIKIR